MFHESDLNGQVGLLDDMDWTASDEITRDSLWRTMKGRRVKIRDMRDGHLLAAIRVLRGLSPIGTTISMEPIKRRQWLNAMANEAYERGLTLDPLTECEKPEEHE